MQRLHPLVARFARDQDGSILLFFAIGLAIMLLAAGGAIDLAMQAIINQRMQQATTMAATSVMQLNNGYTSETNLNGQDVSNVMELTDAQRTQVINRYYRLNMPTPLYGQQTNLVRANFGRTNQSMANWRYDLNEEKWVTVSASSNVRPVFSKMLGVQMTAAAKTRVAINKVNPNGYWIYFDLDYTGDMNCTMTCPGGPNSGGTPTRFSLEKTMVLSFIEQFWLAAPRSRISVGLRKAEQFSYQGSPTTFAYNGSQFTSFNTVAARINGNDPIGQAFQTAGPGTQYGLIEMMQSAAGNTTNFANPYNPNEIKVYIMMTQGKVAESIGGGHWISVPSNNYNNTGYVYNPSHTPADYPAGWTPYEDAVWNCQRLKNAGWIVYTVGFGSQATSDPRISSWMSRCATSPEHFFWASDEEGLERVFSTVGNVLRRTKVSGY